MFKRIVTHVNMVNAAYNVHATCEHHAMNLAAATVHPLPVKNVINSAKKIRLNWTEHIPTVTHLLFLSIMKTWMRMQVQKTQIDKLFTQLGGVHLTQNTILSSMQEFPEAAKSVKKTY